MQFIAGGNCSKLNTITRKKTHAQQVWPIPCHVGKKIKKSMRKFLPSGCVSFKSFNFRPIKTKSHPTWQWKEHPTHEGCLFLFFLGHPIWNIIFVNLIRFPPQSPWFKKTKNKSAKPWRLVHLGLGVTESLEIGYLEVRPSWFTKIQSCWTNWSFLRLSISWAWLHPIAMPCERWAVADFCQTSAIFTTRETKYDLCKRTTLKLKTDSFSRNRPKRNYDGWKILFFQGLVLVKGSWC